MWKEENDDLSGQGRDMRENRDQKRPVNKKMKTEVYWQLLKSEVNIWMMT